MAAPESELKALMLAGLRGDAAAYRTLLARIGDHMRGYFRTRLARFGRSPADAEDLVQEALLAIHTRRETYDPNEPFTPWMHAIARYKLIDHLRRRHMEVSDIPAEDIEAAMAETDDHAGVESALDLKTLMAQLPDKMRRAIECVKVEGLSVEEAAQRCGMSESAIKVSVHRGLKALSRFVAERSEP
jgi:RNA polymerase sigma-70 factor (ECF subfamily)